MDDKSKRNNDIISSTTPVPKVSKTPEDPKRNADKIEYNSTNKENTDNNSTSAGSGNNITKNNGTEKTTIIETDTETTINKDDDKEQMGETHRTDIPTMREHNNRTDNKPNNMGLNKATTNIVQISQEGRKRGAHKGNINISHFMQIK